MQVQPVLIVLFYSSLAVFSSILAAFPFGLWSGVGRRGIGMAYALASGLMLGASYLLAAEGLTFSAIWTAVGAALGVAYTWGTQAFAGTAQLHPDAEDAPRGAEYGYKILLQDTLHSASEGLAIGVAMAVSLPLGIFVALGLAVHNVAEAMALISLLTKRGISLLQSTALSVAARSSQILLALIAFTLSEALPQWLPLALGMAAGSLVFLVMTELLPSSYRRCKRPTVACLVGFATGLLVLLEGYLV